MSFQEYSDSFLSRLHIGEASPNVIRLLAIAMIIVVASIALSVIFALHIFDQNPIEVDSNHEDQAITIESNDPVEPSYIHVHVVGEVLEPGMIELSEDSRVAEAIDAAGGFTESADQTSVNLASVLQDGQQVIVRSKSVEMPVADGQDVSGSAARASDVKININTASASELQSLDGIGPSKAQKIIDYRTSHGSFTSINDLSNVSGIGEKTIQALKDKICI